MTEQKDMTDDDFARAELEKLFGTEISDAEWYGVKYLSKSIEEDKDCRIFNEILELGNKTS